jgi:hypothetical protein
VEAFLLVLLIPVAFGLFALVRARQIRRGTRAHGTRVRAKVDEVVTVLLPSDPSVTSEAGFYVKYRYRDSSGLEHRGKSEVLLTDPNFEIVDGEATVAYDPGHPDSSVWVGR